MIQAIHGYTTYYVLSQYVIICLCCDILLYILVCYFTHNLLTQIKEEPTCVGSKHCENHREMPLLCLLVFHIDRSNLANHHWLVVWNIFFSIIYGMSSFPLTNMFQDG